MNFADAMRRFFKCPLCGKYTEQSYADFFNKNAVKCTSCNKHFSAKLETAIDLEEYEKEQNNGD